MKPALHAMFAFCLLAPAAARATPMPPELADLAARLLPSVVSVASTDPATDNNDNSDNNDNGGDNNDSGGGDSAYHKLRAADTGDASAFVLRSSTSGFVLRSSTSGFVLRSSASSSVLPPPKAEEALGSGFVFDPAGYILTNNHVIDGAISITVTFQDGTILPATVIGRDKTGDLAVLKVDAGRKLPAVTFGDSGKLRIGDWVLAIGNPFGLPGSTSAGIVSALDRDIGEDKYDDFIQTDATINRGNSGGPLFDMSGHVIGINSAIYSPSGGSVGIGFAIPAAMAQPVAESLEHTGGMMRGWLGIATQDVTPDIAHVFNLPDATGALIGGVAPDGPANGKLRPGDDLVSLAGVPIQDSRGLLIRTAEIPAGSAAPVRFWRNGSLRAATVTVAAPPAQLDDTPAAPAAPPPGNVAIPAIGLTVAALTGDAGLPVISVSHGGPAAKAGLVADDTVEQLGGGPVASGADLSARIKIMAQAKQLPVLLVSGDAADGTDPGPRWVALPIK